MVSTLLFSFIYQNFQDISVHLIPLKGACHFQSDKRYVYVWHLTPNKKGGSVMKVNIFGRFKTLYMSQIFSLNLSFRPFLTLRGSSTLASTCSLSNMITESSFFYKTSISWPSIFRLCTAVRQLKCDDDRGQISNLKIRSELQLRIVHNKTDYSSQMQVQFPNNIWIAKHSHPASIAIGWAARVRSSVVPHW